MYNVYCKLFWSWSQAFKRVRSHNKCIFIDACLDMFLNYVQCSIRMLIVRWYLANVLYIAMIIATSEWSIWSCTISTYRMNMMYHKIHTKINGHPFLKNIREQNKHTQTKTKSTKHNRHKMQNEPNINRKAINIWYITML